MQPIRSFFIGFLLLVGSWAQGQEINLLLRQPVHLASSALSVLKESPFNTYHLNVAGEFVPQEGKMAYMLNLGYRYETESYTNFSDLDPRGPFFRECYMAGAVVRRYLGTGRTQYFAEAGLQANFFHRNEALRIRTNYNGIHQEYSCDSETLWGGSLGLGFSTYLFDGIFFEPNIQFVFSGMPQKRLRQQKRVLLPAGSAGMLQWFRNGLSNSRSPLNQYIFLSLSVKKRLFTGSKEKEEAQMPEN